MNVWQQIRSLSPEHRDAPPHHWQGEHRLRHSDRFELESAAEAERTVAEEGDGHDGPCEDVQGIHVWHNAASWLIVVDYRTVDEPLWDHATGHQPLDHQLMHPAWDVVYLSLAVQPLLTGTTFLQLGPVRVSFPEEVLVTEGCPVYSVFAVESSLSFCDHLVNLLLDVGALLGWEYALLHDAALDPLGLLLPELRAVIAVLQFVVIRLSILALSTFSVTRPVDVLIFYLVSMWSHGFQLLSQVSVSSGCHVIQNNVAFRWSAT